MKEMVRAVESGRGMERRAPENGGQKRHIQSRVRQENVCGNPSSDWYRGRTDTDQNQP